MPTNTSHQHTLHTSIHFIQAYTSYLHFIPAYTSYQQTLHTNINFIPIYTSYQHTLYQQTLHANIHFIPVYTSYRPTLHTYTHFISGCTSYQRTLHANIHFIPTNTSYQQTLHTNTHFIPTYTSYQQTIHTNILHTNKHLIQTYTSYKHTLHTNIGPNSAMIQFSAHSPKTCWPLDFYHWGHLKPLEYWALISNEGTPWALIANEGTPHQHIFYACRTIRNSAGTFKKVWHSTIRVSICALIKMEDIRATWGRKQMQLPKRCVWTATRLNRVYNEAQSA